MKYIYVYESPEPQLTVITPEYCKSYGEYGWTTNILKPVAKIPVKELRDKRKELKDEKETVEFRIALNKLVDDDNMPEVLDLINEEILRLLDKLESRAEYVTTRLDSPLYIGDTRVDYRNLMVISLSAIQEERKQYKSKEESK